MNIADIAREIMDGKDFAGNVQLLKAAHREAIQYFLAVQAGTSSYRPAPGVHPRDSHDAALAAISELGKNDVQCLVELLHNALSSEHSEPAFSLTWAIAHLDNATALEPLIEAATHKDQYVRWAACTGLHRLRRQQARHVLNRAAADRSSLVRHVAVEALADLGDGSSLTVLQKRLRDPYPGIRTAAAEAISVITRRGGLP